MKKEYKWSSDNNIVLYIDGKKIKDITEEMLFAIDNGEGLFDILYNNELSVECSYDEATEALANAGYSEIKKDNKPDIVYIYIEDNLSDRVKEKGYIVWLTRKNFFKRHGHLCDSYDAKLDKILKDNDIEISNLSESMYFVAAENLETLKTIVNKSPNFEFNKKFAKFIKE